MLNSNKMPGSVVSVELPPPTKNEVIIPCCLGAIVSTAIGFYGGLLIWHELAWLFMLIMIIGNVACVYISMKYGYECPEVISGAGPKREDPPAIMVTSEAELPDVEPIVAVLQEDSVDGQVTVSVTKTTYTAAPLETHL